MITNIKKEVLWVLLILFSVNKVVAQTTPVFSQYMFNMMILNPAYAGSREVPSITALYRQQWVGIPGEPRTSTLAMDMPMNNNKLGIGLQLSDDRLGLEKSTSLNLSVATHVKVSENGTLSGGLQAGFMNYRANLTQVTTFVSDPTFNVNINKWMPAAGLGLFYNTTNFYAGISAPDILKSRLTDIETATTGVKGINDFHIFTTMGYVIDVNEDIKLKPSMLLKMASGAPAQVDFNTNVWLQNKLGLGVSYRTGDAFVGMVEFQISPQFRVGYSYDQAVSNLKTFSQGSHEFMIRYEFGSSLGNIISPRYF